MSIAKPEVAAVKGMVIYTDGAARPNPGRAGWGMHGYLYRVGPEVKPVSIKNHTITDRGYFPSAAVEKNASPVKVESYVDGFGSFMDDTTNNVAELAGATNAFKYALNHDIKTMLLKTDSEYVLNGLEKWVPRWRSNNWRKADGTEPANVNHWRAIYDSRKALVDKGVKIEMVWVKGHSGIFGNEIADELSVTGVMASKEGDNINRIDTEPAESYWKYDVDAHPFISHSRMYFNTLPETQKPGHYYLGVHGKDDAMLGKRSSDGAYAVIRLKEPEPVLEEIRRHQTAIAHGRNSVCMTRVDYALRAAVHRMITKYGTYAMDQPQPYRLDLFCPPNVEGDPITREAYPPKLAMRAVEALAELESFLDRFIAKDPTLVITDLTDIIYETTDKVGKKGASTKETKLKAEYVVGYPSITAPVLYQKADALVSKVITITLDLDMPDRNSLKRLEKYQPKVSLITWAESEEAFRYATIIETENDIGIWAGYYSNLRIV
jgi:ribonuclease HI